MLPHDHCGNDEQKSHAARHVANHGRRQADHHKQRLKPHDRPEILPHQPHGRLRRFPPGLRMVPDRQCRKHEKPREDYADQQQHEEKQVPETQDDCKRNTEDLFAVGGSASGDASQECRENKGHKDDTEREPRQHYRKHGQNRLAEALFEAFKDLAHLAASGIDSAAERVEQPRRQRGSRDNLTVRNESRNHHKGKEHQAEQPESPKITHHQPPAHADRIHHAQAFAAGEALGSFVYRSLIHPVAPRGRSAAGCRSAESARLRQGFGGQARPRPPVRPQRSAEPAADPSTNGTGRSSNPRTTPRRPAR